jgi:hypothetical protein
MQPQWMTLTFPPQPPCVKSIICWQQSKSALVMTTVETDVRRELDVSGLTDLIGKDAYFETFFDVAEAYQKMAASSKPVT